MEGIAKACDAAASKAFAGLAEAYASVAKVQGQCSVQSHAQVRVLGLKYDAELKAYNELPAYEREKFTRQKLHAAYDHMRKCCQSLRDARANLIEMQAWFSGLYVRDPELVRALDAYGEAELEVKICKIAVNVAEDDVIFRLRQLSRELKCIHDDTKESQEMIRRMVTNMLVEMEAIRTTAICVDTFDML